MLFNFVLLYFLFSTLITTNFNIVIHAMHFVNNQTTTTNQPTIQHATDNRNHNNDSDSKCFDEYT